MTQDTGGQKEQRSRGWGKEDVTNSHPKVTASSWSKGDFGTAAIFKIENMGKTNQD